MSIEAYIKYKCTSSIYELMQCCHLKSAFIGLLFQFLVLLLVLCTDNSHTSPLGVYITIVSISVIGLVLCIIRDKAFIFPMIYSSVTSMLPCNKPALCPPQTGLNIHEVSKRSWNRVGPAASRSQSAEPPTSVAMVHQMASAIPPANDLALKDTVVLSFSKLQQEHSAFLTVVE